MGVWSYVLMGTSDILEKVNPAGLFKTKHFQFLTGLKNPQDEMKMMVVVIF